MGYDGKYGKVTTENGDIPKDEPVIVFRGRDKMLPATLRFYRELCESNGSPQRHLDLINSTLSDIEQWQETYPERVKQPDSERSKEWLGE